DLQPLAAPHLALHRLQIAGQQLGEGRLAVAVDTDQRNAVVGVDAVGNPAQHHMIAITDCDASKVSIGAAGTFFGCSKRNGAECSSNIAAGGFSFWIIFTRACACLALVALALKRSTNFCRCATCASVFSRLLLLSSICMRRVSSMVS